MIDKEFSRPPGKKTVTYKENPIRLSLGFSVKTLQNRKEWNDVLKILKVREHQPSIIYPAMLSFSCKEKYRLS